MKKIVSVVLVIGLVLVSIPFLYAKATFEKRVDQLYQRKLKILMAPVTEEMKPHIKEVAKCQVEMFDSKRFNDSFFRNFVDLLRRVITVKDDRFIRELAVRVDAFEGSQKFLSVNSLPDTFRVSFPSGKMASQRMGKSRS